MPNTRFYDRRSRSHLSVDQGQTVMAPASDGTGTVNYVVPGAEDVSDDMSEMLSQYKAVYELGRPFMARALSADASVEEELIVPANRYWRLIGSYLNYTASADSANRIPIITVENTGGTAFTTITYATITANDVDNNSCLFGTDPNVSEGESGGLAVAANKILTIGEQVTAGDTFKIDTTTYTFIAAGTDPTVAQSPGIELGANEAATKVNIEEVLKDGRHPTVNAAAVFSGDSLTVTARTPGTAGNLIALTETFTNGANVWAGGASTLSAGADAATKLGDKDYPTLGALLIPTDKVVLNVTAGHANDAFEWIVFGLEFDNDPQNSAN